MTDLDELLALEREGWEALSTRDGAAYYAERLADDALMAFAFGVLSRDEAIDAIASAPPWASFEISGARLVELTDDSAVLVYSVTARRAGQDPYAAVVSSTFARRDGRWRLAFHQQSPAG